MTKDNPKQPNDVDWGLQSRILPFDEMIPCTTAFIDARTPGSDKKENYCLIGAGVAENPDQVVHIKIPHGFDVGAARQPNGCKNSHHSHDTEEVFMVHSGDWEFTWGHDGSEGSAIMHTGDIISIPTQMFRGFENVGEDVAMLFSVLGHHPSGAAGNVIWAPYVFANAKHHGLVLLEDGRLIDTANGEVIPDDVKEYTPLAEEELSAFKCMETREFLACICTQNELEEAPRGGLSQFDGVEEIAVIGTANPNENIKSGKMGWEHGFQVRRLRLAPNAKTPVHQREEEEVLFIHSGSLSVTTPALEFTLHARDLFTCPIGMNRQYKNNSNQIVDIFLIRGGNHPASASLV